MLTLAELTNDWREFEQFIADLNSTGDVLVEQNVVMIGASGVKRQIDVLVTHQTKLYASRYIIECKLLNKKVTRQHVDALVATVRDLRAAGGKIFTLKGYQSGAIQQAKADGIELFVVRDLRDDEWGAPGPIVDFYIRAWKRQLLDIRPTNFKYDGPTLPKGARISIELNLHIDDTDGNEDGDGSPEILLLDQSLRPIESLNSRIRNQSMTALREVASLVESQDLKPSAPGKAERYILCDMELRPPNGLTIPAHIAGRSTPYYINFDSFQIKLACYVSQTRITIDRRGNQLFALALINAINSRIDVLSRSNATTRPITLVSNTRSTSEDRNRGALQNGTIFNIFIRGGFGAEQVTDALDLERLIVFE